MYLDFFSLERHPFRITPDPSLFFHGGIRGRGVVLDALVYGITSGEGILKVVGEVGSGKTMLCRMLEECLPDTVEIVYLANPNLSARDIVYAIAFELRLDVDAGTDRLVVMQRLQDYLLKRHAEGATVVVFIEEAQNMPLETLEEIRLLSNLETHRHKLMQIVLFGQPELDQKLAQKSIRQLKERITHSFNLEPLKADEIREYLHFRLKAAGCPWPQLFSPQAEKLLARASDGLTRRINILADKSLLAAYADPATRPLRNAAGEIQPMVHARHVKTAIIDSDYRTSEPGTNGVWRYAGHAAVLLVGIALGAGLLWWLGGDTAGMTGSAAVAPAADEVSVTELAPASSTQGVVVRADAPGAAPVAAAVAEPPPADSVPLPGAAVEAIASATADTGDVPASATVSAATATAMAEAAVTPPSSSDVAPADVTAATVASDDSSRLPPATRVSFVAPVPDSAPPETIEESVVGAVEPEAPPPAAAPSSAAEIVPATRLPRVGGLAAIRLGPSEAWLASLPGKEGYSIQMFAARTSEVGKLEDYLQFLALDDRMDQTYLCLITGNSRRPEQWLVFYSETAGLSESRRLIGDLPPHLARYAPYARNLDDIACANGGP